LFFLGVQFLQQCNGDLGFFLAEFGHLTGYELVDHSLADHSFIELRIA